MIICAGNLSARKYPQMPSWAEMVSGGPGGDYLLVKTQHHHYGILDGNYKLILDTVWDYYGGCGEFSSMPDRNILFLKKRINSANGSCFGGWKLFFDDGKQAMNMTFLLPFDLDGIGDYNERLSVFQDENGKWGLCDHNLKIKQPPVYDHIWTLQKDTHSLREKMFFLVQSDKHFGVVGLNGKLVLDTSYTAAIRYSDLFAYLADKEDTIIVDPDGGNDTLHIQIVHEPPGLSKEMLKCEFEYGLKYASYDYFGDYVFARYENDYDYQEYNYWVKCLPEIPRYGYVWTNIYYQDSNVVSWGISYLHEYPPYYSKSGYDLFVDRTKKEFNDSVYFENFSVRGKDLNLLTMASVFVSMPDLKSTLWKCGLKANDLAESPTDSLELSSKFLIEGKGLELYFVSWRSGAGANVPLFISWNDISGLLDPNGPLRNRIIRK